MKNLALLVLSVLMITPAFAMKPLPEKAGTAKLHVPPPSVSDKNHQDKKPILIAKPKHSLKEDIKEAEALEQKDESSPE